MKALVLDKYQGDGKLKAIRSKHVTGYSKGISNYDKLTTKNANRGKVKSCRQQSKRDILIALNEL